MRRTRLTFAGCVLACCLASPLHATDVDGPNDCLRPNQDFGDAPEGTAVFAYPGVPGRFPTCTAPGPVGIRNTACLPISTVPGAAGYVMHSTAVGAPVFWLGCPTAAAPSGIDSESDGKVNNSPVVGDPSACSGIPTDCVEAAFGLSFGQDECYGSTDAGVLRPNLRTCKPATVRFTTTNCATAALTVYLNILVDMNHDGDWNDNFQCAGACAYEWAVKNVTISLPVGCASLTSPAFLVGPNVGNGWMRVSISLNPVNDDFPWAGSVTMPGGLQGGETEDYPVVIRKPALAVLNPIDITWATIPTDVVRFSLRFRNEDTDDASEPASGNIMSQQFGVFLPDYGQIGSFQLPAIQPNSFFDIFVDIPLSQLPPSALEVLPWMGGTAETRAQVTSQKRALTACPPDDHWDGNVDINWSSPSGASQVNKHIGTIQVCPAHGNSYIHVLVFCNDPAGATWSISGLCPGWSATLVNEGPPLVPDGPAPNPVPPGWTGFICISASAAVLPGATCPLKLTFTCSGVDGVIDLEPIACDCTDNLCHVAYRDFGDAPEEINAYSTGMPGHFPTCIFATPPGNLQALCGAALGTPPGPTGYVLHQATATDAVHLWLGCGVPPGPGGVDSEADGKVAIAAAAGTPSACDQNVLTDCLEFTADGMSFGQDECYGDGVDAAITSPVEMARCSTSVLTFNAMNCTPNSIDAFVNVLFDWNQDGDWNDNFPCGTTCVNEWTFHNYVVVLSPGCNTITLPSFQVGPRVGPSWMRLTLTHAPVKDDFPWNGSLGEANGYYVGGETEDYPVRIRQSVVGADEGSIPSEIRLGVLPNPSGSSVNVSLALPKESFAVVAVYDLAGRKLATLANGQLAAGVRNLHWNFRSDDGRQVPVGMYLVRADVDGRIVTRTLVRIR
jgi:hypothetical protein